MHVYITFGMHMHMKIYICTIFFFIVMSMNAHEDPFFCLDVCIGEYKHI